MAYVYVLSDYDEHGAENVCATLDRHMLHLLLTRNWPGKPNSLSGWGAEAHAELEGHLKKSDEDLAANASGWNCNSGWGGVQLHVIELAV